jgi:hypothetical protein
LEYAFFSQDLLNAPQKFISKNFLLPISIIFTCNDRTHCADAKNERVFNGFSILRVLCPSTKVPIIFLDFPVIFCQLPRAPGVDIVISR